MNEALPLSGILCVECDDASHCVSNEPHLPREARQGQILLRRLAAKGGPDPNDYVHLNRLLSMLHSSATNGALSQRAICELRRELPLHADTMQGLAFLKPNGYAGDYQIIDRIYTLQKASDPQLRKWDEYFHSHAAVNAVRNRKDYFLEVMRHLHSTHQERSLEILNIASGPARDLREYFDEFPGCSTAFTCIEADRKAIAYSKLILGKAGDNVSFHNANALTWRSRKRFDLIWSAGLFDYLNDSVFVRFLSRLMSSVKADGEIVIGNFSDDNPSRPYMELVGEWHLHHRSEKALRKLACDAGSKEKDVAIGAEKLGVNLFLHVTNGMVPPRLQHGPIAC